MSADTITVVAVIVAKEIGLSTPILATTGRLGTRLAAVEKETAGLGELMEGLGMAGRIPQPPRG